jgi:hypothetical protein
VMGYPPRLSSAQRAELVRRYQEGETSVTLSAECGLSRERVCQYVRKAGVVRTNAETRRLRSESRRREALRLFRELKLSPAEIARRVSADHVTVTRWLREEGEHRYSFQELLTPGEWWLAYWGDPEEPSFVTLEARLEVPQGTLMRVFRALDLPTRSKREAVQAAAYHGRMRKGALNAWKNRRTQTPILKPQSSIRNPQSNDSEEAL